MIQSVTIDLSVSGKQYGPYLVADDDDLHYRFVRAIGTGTLTATLTVAYGLTPEDEPHDSAVLTVDGTDATVNIENRAYLYFIVGTAQSGQTGVLHFFTRKRAVQTV